MHPRVARARQFASDLQTRVRRNRTTLIAAGVAFYAFLSIVPALIAAVSVYGLVADPSDIPRQVDSFAAELPAEVRAFLEFQLRAIARSDRAGVSITLALSLVVALWSASSGTAALLAGIRLIHRRDDPMRFFARRGRALAATIGAILAVNLVVFLIAALPPLVDNILGEAGRAVVGLVRWVLLAAVMVTSIGGCYRLAVRQPGRWLGIVTPGTLVATLLWLLVSFGFSFYAANFAGYAETYGSLATIVILMLWLWLSVLVVLIGAEVDARSAGAPAKAGAPDR